MRFVYWPRVFNLRKATPLFITSITASVARRTSGNWQTATLVSSKGASRSVANKGAHRVSFRVLVQMNVPLPSVIIPKVPSAPINNLVVSNPAEDLRARLRVLITSPEGSTTVYLMEPFSPMRELGGKMRHGLRTMFKNHSALAVPYLTALAG